MNYDEAGIFFEDRIDAGQKLAQSLRNYFDEPAIVYGLPRGGVIVAKEVAEIYKAPLDLIITRKIGHHLDPEYAIGAITEDGQLIGNREELALANPNWLQEEISKQKAEAKRRRDLYLKGAKQIDVSGKTAIIVDDGIATGFTMLAAIKQIKDQSPKKIIIAVPVCPPDIASVIKNEVDDLVTYSNPEFFLGAISGYYLNFPQVSDEEIIEIMNIKESRRNDSGEAD